MYFTLVRDRRQIVQNIINGFWAESELIALAFRDLLILQKERHGEVNFEQTRTGLQKQLVRRASCERRAAITTQVSTTISGTLIVVS